MKTNLLYILRDIRNGEHNTENGICHNVTINARNSLLDYASVYAVERLSYALMEQWPEYSGWTAYPIKDPQGGRPDRAFWAARNKWEGEYGEARMRLLNWMIEELEKPE